MDRTIPTRQHARLDRATRARLTAEHRDLVDEQRAEDRLMASLATRRRRRLERLAAIHDQLWPTAAWPQGRRPQPDQLVDPLPPLPEQPIWLWGRRLRAVCLRLLHRCGTLPLRQLHALLHLHGFGVAGDRPVKTLADALGHEADHGHAERPARGHYRTARGYRPPPQREPWLSDATLPDLDGELDLGPSNHMDPAA